MRKKNSDKSVRLKPTFVAMIIIVVAVIAYLSLNYAYRQQKVGTRISVGINVGNGLISGMPLDANPTTFTWLGDGYGKDAKQVYIGGKTIAEADPATFISLGHGYAEDSSHVWFAGAPIYGADVVTFKSLGDTYAKDKNRVYNVISVIAYADPSTFTPLSPIYAKDDRHVYFEADIVKGADTKTFITLSNSVYGRDKNGFYCSGTPFTVSDSKTFALVGEQYFLNIAKDAKHVYDYCAVVDHANPAKCTVENLSACNVARLKGYSSSESKFLK